MLKKPLQDSFNISNIIGIVVVPVLFYIPFIHNDWLHTNYTGIINENWNPFEIISIVLGLGYLAYTMYPQFFMANKRIHFTLASFFTLLGLFIPYNDSSLLSSFHLLFSYLAFIYVQYFVFQIFMSHPQHGIIYLALLVVAGLITFTFHSINGLSEWIFFSTLSVLLTSIKK